MRQSVITAAVLLAACAGWASPVLGQQGTRVWQPETSPDVPPPYKGPRSFAQAGTKDESAVDKAVEKADGKAGGKADDKKNADAADEEKLAVKFEFFPSSVSMNSSLSFDQNGKVNSSNSSMSISVRVKYESDAQPVQVRNIRTTSVITDSKENLDSRSQNSEQTLFSWENSSRGQTQRSEFHLQMSFIAPSRAATRIAEIRGTMDVIYASGTPSEAVLKPFSEFESKRITFKDMPGQFIRFSREERANNQDRIRVEMPKDLRPHIASIKFYDEASRELTFSGWGGGSNGTTEYRTINVPLPEKGQIRVQMYPRVDTRQVPFVIKDLPITPEAKEAGGEIMVELKPIGPVDGELRLERLDAVVEQ